MTLLRTSDPYLEPLTLLRTSDISESPTLEINGHPIPTSEGATSKLKPRPFTQLTSEAPELLSIRVLTETMVEAAAGAQDARALGIFYLFYIFR